MTSARFAVNAVVSTIPFDAAHDQVLTLELEDDIDPSIFKVQWFCPDAADPTAPLASLTAPALTLAPSNGIPVSVGGSVTVTMPSSGAHSWAIRCVVNDGYDRATGRIVPAWTFTRIIDIRSSNGLRKEIPAESTEYSPRGWSDEQNRMVDALNAELSAGDLPAGAADTVLLENHAADAVLFAKLKDANVDAAAAIAGTKIAPNFGAQNIVTTGSTTAGHLRATDLVAGPVVADASGNLSNGAGAGASFGILYYADVATAEAAATTGLPDEALMRVQTFDRFYVLRTSGLNAHGEALAIDHFDNLATPTSAAWEGL